MQHCTMLSSKGPAVQFGTLHAAAQHGLYTSSAQLTVSSVSLAERCFCSRACTSSMKSWKCTRLSCARRQHRDQSLFILRMLDAPAKR